ncbi:MAG TPA: hypothetical protein VFH75_02955 [Actinomycetota bacterium]|nr:hypothetical protein [Actinomycetota bacterium]
MAVSCGGAKPNSTAKSPKKEAGGDVAAFCDGYIEMVQASDSEEELRSLGEKADALFDEVEANAPQEVSGPVGVVVDATRQAAAEGTPEAFMSREFDVAVNELNSYMFDNCESDAKLDVTGVEYAFEGVPDTVSAGRVALRFTNDGDQPHEFIVFRKNDGVTESFDEILELPEGQSEERMTFVGATFADPGESNAAVFEAEAGEYIALCFFPVGATVEGPEPEEGEGPPGPDHWVEGMRSEFTVE